MPSLFAGYESLVSEAIDGVWGDITRIVRRQSGQQFFAGPANGPFVDVVGIVDINPVTVRQQDEGSYDGFIPQLPGESYHVSYDLTNLRAAGYQPKKDDEIICLSQDEGANLSPLTGLSMAQVLANPALAPLTMTLKVTRADPDGLGRIICVCTKAK